MSCARQPGKGQTPGAIANPLHAATEIERVLKDVRQDRMPLDDSGIEKPLPEKRKNRLLADAEAFAVEIRLARAWEARNGAKSNAR